RALLVAGEDVTDGAAVEGVVERKDGTARYTERHLHAFVGERLQEDVGAGRVAHGLPRCVRLSCALGGRPRGTKNPPVRGGQGDAHAGLGAWASADKKYQCRGQVCGEVCHSRRGGQTTSGDGSWRRWAATRRRSHTA